MKLGTLPSGAQVESVNILEADGQLRHYYRIADGPHAGHEYPTLAELVSQELSHAAQPTT